MMRDRAPSENGGEWIAEFFLARFPMYSSNQLLDWSAASTGIADNLAKSEELYSSTVNGLCTGLRQIAQDPAFRDAILLASDQLGDAMAKEPGHHDPKAQRRLDLSIFRYFSRAATRPTPFGLFAGCATGKIVEAPTAIRLADFARWKIRTTLDSEVIIKISSALNEADRDQRRLRYVPNSSIFSVGAHLLYVETSRQGLVRHYVLARALLTPEVALVLESARTGATRSQLDQILCERGFSLDESSAFVDELIESELLECGVLPAISCDIEPLEQLIATLGELHYSVLAEPLVALRDFMAAGDAAGPIRGTEFFRRAKQLAKPFAPDAPISRLFQTDLIAATEEMRLSRTVVTKLVGAMQLLQRTLPPRDPLRSFRKRFQARYERREVPLVEALDPEFGLGLDDYGRAEAGDFDAGFDRRLRVLTDLVVGAARSERREVILTQAHVDLLGGDLKHRLPDSLSIHATIGVDDEGQEQIRLSHAIGPSGAQPLARFCRWDETLCQNVRAFLNAEEASHPNAVLAEIVHWPQDRVGNVITRPRFYENEILYMGGASRIATKTILVDDLLLSLRDKTFVLRSRSMNREVLPRLTNAHNYGHPQSLPVYRFLAALQGEQCVGWVSWDWGPLQSCAWLPRVRIGEVVVARECWRLAALEAQQLQRATGHERFRLVQKVRAAYAWPRHILLAVGDNELFVDLDNPVAVDALVEQTRKSEAPRVVEAWPSPHHGVAVSPTGRHATEVIVPVRQRHTNAPTSTLGAASGGTLVTTRRTFPPGSEWLYYKLYGGEVSAFEALREVVWPLLTESRREGTVASFFWLRYYDPQHHLRIRLRGDGRIWSQVFPALAAALDPLTATGHLTHIEVATYEREIERYGGPEGILLAEQFFEWSSVFALRIVERIVLQPTTTQELARVIVSTGRVLAQFAFPGDTLVDALARTEESAGQSAVRTTGDEVFRSHRALLDAFVGLSPIDAPPHNAESSAMSTNFLSALAELERGTRGVVSELRRLENVGNLNQNCVEIARSFVHMHVNRLVAGATAREEAVVCGVLRRHFASLAARGALTRARSS